MARGNTFKLNAKQLGDLNLIISSYENKSATQSKGEKSAITALSPLEGMQATLQTTYDTIDPQNAVGSFFSDIKKGIAGVNDEINKNTTQVINDALKDFYAKGKQVNRETKITEGPIDIKIKNTFVGLANAKNAEEALSVLMNDCIPCQPRIDAIKFEPNLSFLEQIIQKVKEFIDRIVEFVKSLLDEDDTSTNICLSFNLLNFTCLPDFNALNIMLEKGVTISLKSPSFKLPGLGDIFSIIIIPILASVANLAQAWVNIVINPIECIIKSLDSLIRKFNLDFGKLLRIVDPKVKVEFTPGEISYGKDLLPSEKSNRQVLLGSKKYSTQLENIKLDPSTADKLNVGKQVQKLLPFLLKLRQFISNIKAKILSFISKFIKKFQAALSNGTKGMSGFLTSLQEILKITSMITTIKMISKLFTGQYKGCNDKDKAIDDIKNVAANELAKERSNIPTLQSGDLINPTSSIIKEFKLTPNEIAALGLKEMFQNKGTTIDITPIGDNPISTIQNSVIAQDLVNVKVISKIDLSDCVTIASREQFISVDTLISAF